MGQRDIPSKWPGGFASVVACRFTYKELSVAGLGFRSSGPAPLLGGYAK